MFLGEPWMDEHARSQPRRRVLFVSTLNIHAVPMKCKVRDVSVNGALIEVSMPLQEDTEAELVLPKIGTVACTVAWVRHFRCGLLFKQMLDPFQLREMLEEKPRNTGQTGADAPRWQRPSAKTELDDRSRGAVAWLREQKRTAK